MIFILFYFILFYFIFASCIFFPFSSRHGSNLKIVYGLQYNPFCIGSTSSSFHPPSKNQTDTRVSSSTLEESCLQSLLHRAEYKAAKITYPKSHIAACSQARTRVRGLPESPLQASTLALYRFLSPKPQRSEVYDTPPTPRPYLGQAGVLVHVLAFLHAGSQLLQDAPAACQGSGQPSKLPPA